MNTFIPQEKNQTPGIRFHGRTLVEDGKAVFHHTGSGFRACFFGTSLKAVVEASHSMEDSRRPFITIFVDKKMSFDEETVHPMTKPMNDITLASGLPLGIHCVDVYKRSEMIQSTIGLHLLETDGEFVSLDEDHGLNIEFIGDSLTAGYGNLGHSAEEPFSTETEDGMQSYAVIASRTLDAAFEIAAVSGIGMYKSPYQSVSMPEVYRSVSMDEEGPADLSEFDPDFVVINLGTNDNAFIKSVSIEERQHQQNHFESCYRSFLDQMIVLRSNAKFLLIAIKGFGEWTNPRIENIAAAYDKKSVRLLYFDEILPEEGLGSDYHPSVLTHHRWGADLARFIHLWKNEERREDLR